MDGPRRQRAWRPAWGWLAAALGVVAGSVGYLVHEALSPQRPPPAALAASTSPPVAAVASSAASAVPPRGAVAPTPAMAAPPALPVPAARIARTREPGGDLTPDLADFVNEGERPTMGEVIRRLHAAGVHAGVGAFSPPGTRPPLIGLAVPEDFALPPGYVRHYQATDDGQRIEPILMFSPDAPPPEAAGRTMAVPADRVVPPELAPPGLPLRRIVLPPAADDGGAAR